jgi:hypothetical protein
VSGPVSLLAASAAGRAARRSSFLGEIEDRVAAGALVARVHQGVEREWVVFCCRDLFFNERAEDTELDGVEVHVYKGAIAEGSVGTDDNE